MPEGDTIHKIAGFMAPRLRGRVLERVAMADRAAAGKAAGRVVEDVFARGKHLFVALDDSSALRSHLGMYGSWHVYGPDDEWQKPRGRASLVLEAGGELYVCFNAKEVEFLTSHAVRQRIVETRLGPDLVADRIDADAIVRRAREFLEEDALLADALLDQRVACGIGNVYKSEVLFLEGILPLTRIGSLADAAIGRCFELAAELLRRNLGGGRRMTRFENDRAGRLWVYGRGGLPCLSCDEGRIASARLGRHHRGTFWCRQCQQ